MHPFAAAAWLSVSVAALVSVARGGDAIGLDFEGGAMLSLATLAEDGRCDPREVDAVLQARHPDLVYALEAAGERCQVNFAGLSDEPTVDAVARTLVTEPATRLTVEHSDVLTPALTPVLGRPTALALGVTATLLWCASLVSRGRALAVAGAAVTALAFGLAWLLGSGSTLSRASYLAAVWFAPAIAVLTATSGRPRFRCGFVGVLVLAVLVAVAAAVQTLDVRAAGELAWVRAAARMALTHAVPAAALALLAIWTVREA
ncbi:hypothetical protein OV203_45630 [Nannocystis sp. ILAH1]|uniref:hypothetical protein n=1 Tax=unclassified Nannocystis TaxID=2627009 RepID=UPI00226FE974|nr:MULTISPECIES: hypothetical protein [unclassified Nannocystis]MCY0994491.1 hypothetical protein [Nannocystis sp. ILAH1]MCY1063579.1 hypothetical protein [Nannocystis sp. RBIL2]